MARSTVEFKAAAEFDEILEVYVRVAAIGKTSLTFRFEIYAANDGRLVNQAESVYVCVDPKTLEKIPVPGDLRQRIATFEDRTL